MDKSTANVSFLQEKLSKEAFGGSGGKLLNSKYILIADTEGTQGMCTCGAMSFYNVTVNEKSKHVLKLQHFFTKGLNTTICFVAHNITFTEVCLEETL